MAAKNFFRKNGHWKNNMPSEDQHPLPSLKAAIAKIMRGRKDADQSYHQHCSALATPREDGTTLQEWAVTLFEAFQRARCHDVFISKVRLCQPKPQTVAFGASSPPLGLT